MFYATEHAPIRTTTANLAQRSGNASPESSYPQRGRRIPRSYAHVGRRASDARWPVEHIFPRNASHPTDRWPADGARPLCGVLVAPNSVSQQRTVLDCAGPFCPAKGHRGTMATKHSGRRARLMSRGGSHRCRCGRRDSWHSDEPRVPCLGQPPIACCRQVSGALAPITHIFRLHFVAMCPTCTSTW
jgi:hypothetical protein